MPLPDPEAIKHRWYEDVLGIGAGVLLCVVGLHVLATLGFITGQMAGAALLVAQVSGLPFGLLFFVMNLPFYLFGLRKMGWAFTLRSLTAVGLLSIGIELVPYEMVLGPIDPGFGVLVFGVLTSIGLLAIFRHRASMGGMTILALYLQDRGVAKAGTVQMAFDLCLFAAALWLFPWSVVAWSLAGAVVLNVMIALNHRKDRYIAN